MRVALIGAGRHAHNLAGLLEDAGWVIDTFLDENITGHLFGRPILSFEGYHGPTRDALLSIGSPAGKMNALKRLENGFAFDWATFVHPGAIVSAHASLDPGVFVAPFTTLADVEMGAHAMVLPFSMLGARVAVGAFSAVGSHCAIHSDVTIGEGTLIDSGVTITAGLRIGSNCQIASGAIVRHDVPDGSMVAAPDRTRTLRSCLVDQSSQ